MDYRKTLNLPRTSFPMKANLPQMEPQILDFWQQNKIYQLVVQEHRGDPPYILHDGPPYSNGRIHLGQALNKILKDIVIKFRTLRGHYSPYVPGWDTHGLPNEIQAIKTFKLNRKEIDPVELRKKCKESALHFVEIQREQFKRLGVMGDWDHPYLTLNPSYEATVVRAFGDMAEKGHIYKGRKPVYWCASCETSLAEAEIEYQDKESPSITVKFPARPGLLARFGIQDSREGFVLIWTTTPWTLPGNVAIALHPDETYAAVRVGSEIYVVAEALLAGLVDNLKLPAPEILGKVNGKALEGALCRHPFLDRDSVLVVQSYVTMDQGTGCVHTAPGHGQDDYEAALAYHLPILVPVDNLGFLTEEAGPFAGLFIDDANPRIIEHLQNAGLLLAAERITHSYPHCWRCRKPVLFRATEQWFVNVDANDLRKKALQVIKEVKWYPSWGEERISNMVTDRPDWCISRQRLWGVPIPVFYCETCKEALFTKETISSVEACFEKEGADAWYVRKAEEILPQGFACPRCQGTTFRKEMDIFDVWFESGVSHLAVLEKRPELSWPCDLYLEGSDQHRGWFQVSLLAALGSRGRAPYREVLTHGWVLDAEGKTMHKSLGNVIDPMEILKDHGADVLRLFIASVDYKGDVRIGDEVLKQSGEVYRKIRNTFRYLLGNLNDFDPRKDSIPRERMLEIDRWALLRLGQLVDRVTNAYSAFEFHLVFYHLHNFCATDLSAVYLDVIKDRLYTYAPCSPERRSAQTALYKILMDLLVIAFPILSFTAEEIWQNLPVTLQDRISVQLLSWPKPEPLLQDAPFDEKWQQLLRLRNDVYGALEEVRQKKIVNQAQEASVDLYLPPDIHERIKQETDLLRMLFMVSQLNLHSVEGELPSGMFPGKEFSQVRIRVDKAAGVKCPRCWNFFMEQPDEKYGELCPRCSRVMETGPAIGVG